MYSDVYTGSLGLPLRFRRSLRRYPGCERRFNFTGQLFELDEERKGHLAITHTFDPVPVVAQKEIDAIRHNVLGWQAGQRYLWMKFPQALQCGP